jgi:hypothetical protein
MHSGPLRWDGGATFPWVRDLEPGPGGDQVKPTTSDGQGALYKSQKEGRGLHPLTSLLTLRTLETQRSR